MRNEEKKNLLEFVPLSLNKLLPWGLICEHWYGSPYEPASSRPRLARLFTEQLLEKSNSSKKLPLGKPLPAHMADKERINLTKWLPAGSGPVLEAGTRGVVLCLAREQPHRSGINHVLLLCHSLGLGRGGVAGRQTAESKGSYFLGFWICSFVGPLLRAGHLSR